MCSYGKSNSFGAMWQSSTTSAALIRARLADLAPHLTPHRYAFNNPIRYHDPSGLFEVAIDGGGEPPSLLEVDGIAVSIKEVVIYADRVHKYNFSSTLVGKVIANVPVLGGISQAVEGALIGDWKNAAIGLGSASLDVVLFTTTAGTGNILRIIFKETAANTVSQQLTDNLQDFGIPTAIILPIAIVAGSKLNPSKKLGVADDVGVAAKGGGKFSKAPPGNLTKLKGKQGWRDENGYIWKKDMKHKDHWDVTDPKTNTKIKEIDFEGNQIWPDGPKNKNKR